MNGLVITVVEVGCILINVPFVRIRDSSELAAGVGPDLMWGGDLLSFLDGRFRPGTSSKVVSVLLLAAQKVVWNGRELHRGTTLEEEDMEAALRHAH